MNEYSDYILELYKNPVKKQRLMSPTQTVESINTSCGDSIIIDLLIENNIIRDIGWEGKGCAISQAGMSIIAEEIVGKTVDQTVALESAFILNSIGFSLSPKRTKCALLGLEALRKLH